ncbi:hypothetical protein DK26_08165 [Bosea sp. WAO]|uniref:hypothetical protein n=1 Tax=Bosea sp. WAO TaxID=406341 RepID=UPI0007498EDD|nr:hypothetical protein [Bosea sp. WAO]KUL95995.1 hypothetical protein DK26_08165 [Bosea sp. WAO]
MRYAAQANNWHMRALSALLLLNIRPFHPIGVPDVSQERYKIGIQPFDAAIGKIASRTIEGATHGNAEQALHPACFNPDNQIGVRDASS